ncbi:MAG: hypothetical protein ACREE0_20320 [Phenylobacterium sp.]
MSDPTSFYVGWLVDPGDREALLARIAPSYPLVVAHHVTFKFGDRGAALPTETSGEIVGEADDGLGVQALVVRIGGTTARPDGGTYHITWSLADGREARESNAVIGERGWTEIPSPVRVGLHPQGFERA